MRLRKLLLGAMMAMTLSIPASASQGVAMASASTPTLCHNAALTPTVGRGSAAAGTAYETLIIKNHSSHACTLSGAPATQFGNFVGSAGLVVFRAIGPAAKKLTLADRGKTVAVKPGAVASVTVGIETAVNFPSATWGHLAKVSRVRLVFHSGITLYYTLRTNAVCAKIASTLTSGVVLGTRFP